MDDDRFWPQDGATRWVSKARLGGAWTRSQVPGTLCLWLEAPGGSGRRAQALCAPLE